jgi:hypothetical protein
MKAPHPQFLRFHYAVASLVLTLCCLASPAHAVMNFGTIVCDFAQQTGGWPLMVSWIAYIAGTFFVARSLFLAKMYTEDPGRNPFHRIWLYAFVGAACLVFPSFIAMLVKTVHGTLPGVGGAVACTPGAVTIVVLGAGIPVGLDSLLTNFVGNIRDPAFMFIGWVCYCLGTWFIFKGLNKMSKYNTDPKAYSINAIMANFFVGALFMWLGRVKDMMMASIFGAPYGTCNGLVSAGGGIGGASTACGSTTTTGLINWAGLGITTGTASFDSAFIAATVFFQIVGFIAFIRGWMLAKASVEGIGNTTMGQAITHIIGGALCMNIVLFLRAASATFGVNFFT